MATAAQWEPTDYVSLPIGQVDAVSALQVLDAYNAVANGGTFVQPKLVEATVDQSGGVTTTAPSPTHRVFSPPVDSELTSMLEQVVSNGTGTSAVVPGLHGGRQDRHGADPDHGQGRLHRRRLHGLVRRLRPGGEPDVLHDRGPRSPHADLRGDGGRSGVLPDHELCAASLRHPDHPGRGQPAGGGTDRPAARRRTSHEPVPSAGRGGRRGAPVPPLPSGRPCGDRANRADEPSLRRHRSH